MRDFRGLGSRVLWPQSSEFSRLGAAILKLSRSERPCESAEDYERVGGLGLGETQADALMRARVEPPEPAWVLCQTCFLLTMLLTSSSVFASETRSWSQCFSNS